MTKMGFTAFLTALLICSASAEGSPAKSALTASEHLEIAAAQRSSGHFARAAQHLELASKLVPRAQRAEISFQLGECQFRLGEWDSAAGSFSDALSAQTGDQLTESCLKHLFEIAEKFRLGARRRPFGLKYLPKWAGNTDGCLHLYNLVAETRPYGELASKSLYAKGLYLQQLGEFARSNEAFFALISVFPEREVAIQSRSQIARNFRHLLSQSPGDDELLAQASADVEQLQRQFPDAEHALGTAREELTKMRELSAQENLRTAHYFERRGLPEAARVYFEHVVQQFPDTASAQTARVRLVNSPAAK